MKNPFVVLGCKYDSTREEIIKKYKTLARTYHPDRNTNINPEEKAVREEQFKEITCAYEFLKKNNFKYNSHFEPEYSKFSDIFKSKFFGSNEKIYGMLNGIKNFNLDYLADNMLKGITTIQDIYDNNDDRLEKARDICINANVELIDIYNCMKKTIDIDITIKCDKCLSLGYDINTKLKCSQCNGNKLVNIKQKLDFCCLYKNITFKGKGNEEIGKRAGNIYINLLSKPHTDFSIINGYDIFYRYIICFEDIVEEKIVHQIEYLDLKRYNLTINKVKVVEEYRNKRLYQVSIDNYGLYYPGNGERGKLIIDIFDPQGLLNNLEKIGKENEIEFTEE